MLNHTFLNRFRPSLFQPLASCVQLTARKQAYENVKVHRTKYKSMAKDRRKAIKRT